MTNKALTENLLSEMIAITDNAIVSLKQVTHEVLVLKLQLENLATDKSGYKSDLTLERAMEIAQEESEKVA